MFMEGLEVGSAMLRTLFVTKNDLLYLKSILPFQSTGKKKVKEKSSIVWIH